MGFFEKINTWISDSGEEEYTQPPTEADIERFERLSQEVEDGLGKERASEQELQAYRHTVDAQLELYAYLCDWGVIEEEPLDNPEDGPSDFFSRLLG